MNCAVPVRPNVRLAVEFSLTPVRSRASGWIFGFDRAQFRRVIRHEFAPFGHEKERRDTTA